MTTIKNVGRHQRPTCVLVVVTITQSRPDPSTQQQQNILTDEPGGKHSVSPIDYGYALWAIIHFQFLALQHGMP